MPTAADDVDEMPPSPSAMLSPVTVSAADPPTTSPFTPIGEATVTAVAADGANMAVSSTPLG